MTNTNSDKPLTAFRQVWQFLHNEGKCDQIDSDEFNWVHEDWEHNLRPIIGMSCFMLISVKRFAVRQRLLKRQIKQLEAQRLTEEEEHSLLIELLDQTVERHGLVRH